MSLSNSFHSSAKKHAISGGADLARVERHNSRGYYSFYYDESKIDALIGTPGTLVADVQRSIDATFRSTVDAYNEKQRRRDRQITASPYQYFCDNKNLDIANEAIFQIGDKAFWDKWRTDTVIQTAKGEVTLKDFPTDVKEAMDEIFVRQAEAYEKIYETHGDEIYRRMASDKEAAQKLVDEFLEAEKKKYDEILALPLKSRKTAINALQEPAGYTAYADAVETLATIKKLRLDERTKGQQMHIKLVNLTAHYDEFSPHAHGVSICWADGYKSGLAARVAKSTVLNRWALSVIQDRLREIAKEEIEQRPEIFGGEILAEKQIGRNLDYSTEQIARQKQRELIEKNNRLEQLNASLREQVSEATEEARVSKDRAAALAQRVDELETTADDLEQGVADLQGETAELIESLQLIRTYEQYLGEARDINVDLDEAEELAADLEEQRREARGRATPHIDRLLRWLSKVCRLIESGLQRLRIYERHHDVPERLSEPAQQRKDTLDAMIGNAASRTRQGGTETTTRDGRDRR